MQILLSFRIKQNLRTFVSQKTKKKLRTFYTRTGFAPLLLSHQPSANRLQSPSNTLKTSPPELEAELGCTAKHPHHGAALIRAVPLARRACCVQVFHAGSRVLFPDR